MTATDLRVRAYRSFDELPFDASTWDALVERGDTAAVFLTHGWQRAWWRTFSRGRLLIVVLEDEHGRPAVLAPFFVDGGMAFLVGSGGSDQLDLIGAVDVDRVEAILRTLWQEEPDLLGVHLYHVPDASSTGYVLQAACARGGFDVHDEGEHPAPALDLRPAGAAQAAASKKSLVRHENWFRREGELEVATLCEPAAIRGHLGDFFEQHCARWADTPHPSLFVDPLQRAFYRRLVDEVGPRGSLRFTTVSWDGRPIAYHFGTCHAGTFLWYKPSFDVTLARRSPGEVLLRNLLLQAASEHATTFDFGLGDEPFKQRFATSTPLVRNWGVYPVEGR